MIEKFTPEELEQIQRELTSQKSPYNKRYVVAPHKERLLKRLKKCYPDFTSKEAHRVINAMYTLTNALLQNRGYSNQILACDPHDYAEVYRKIADTICFIIDNDLPAMRKKGKADERD